jgi:hypothetical protein
MGLLCCSVASGTCKSGRRRVFDEEHHVYAGLWALWQWVFHGDEEEGNIRLTDDRSDLLLGFAWLADSPRTFRGAGADSVEARSRISGAGYIGSVEALDSYGQRLSSSAMVDAGG